MCIADVSGAILKLPDTSPVTELSLNYTDASNNNVPFGVLRCLVTPKEEKKNVRFIGIDASTNSIVIHSDDVFETDELYFDETTNI